MSCRILVTGVGAVSAAGMSVQENIRTLDSGKRALSPFPSFVRTSLELPVGEVKADNASLEGMLGLSRKNPVTRTALLAAVAASEAVMDAGLEPGVLSGGRTGLVIGTSVGGMDISEVFYEEYRKDSNGCNPGTVRMHDCGATVSFVSSCLGIRGFSTAVSTACSSAGNAIMLAARMIRAGLLDAAIAGGADSLSRFTLNGFNSMRILSSSPCLPFDAARDGLNLGEGAGFVVLQRETDVTEKAYCCLGGWANADEAFHQTGSSSDGRGAFEAMSGALESASLNPEDIDYVNTHGTATPGNDLAEGTALKRLFGGSVPFGSFKGYIGHTLAASEGIEAVLCAVSVKEGKVWPSAGFSVEDPSIGISPFCPPFPEYRKIRHLLSNSFGFGGNNTSLVFSAV